MLAPLSRIAIIVFILAIVSHANADYWIYYTRLFGSQGGPDECKFLRTSNPSCDEVAAGQSFVFKEDVSGRQTGCHLAGNEPQPDFLEFNTPRTGYFNISKDTSYDMIDSQGQTQGHCELDNAYSYRCLYQFTVEAGTSIMKCTTGVEVGSDAS
ncbi:uncharacterized protein JN550_000824 [Neoarthrinium moseri]|uniref:uncharacterized protein n=1 Tax=Neoarthrinium moseri TaxID=1658444 RepID=UPI001FDB5307|nr:uncharacterized protein JN550_000824 [Neoarthrinium moseri]KAI1876752.1 hypothetical protein JN550_000824 [Neoarthrinium moseri]